MTVNNALTAVTALRLAGYGLGFVSQILLARMFGSSVYGEYIYLFTVITYIAILCRLGLELPAIRDLPRYLEQGALQKAHGILRFTTWLPATLAALLAVPVLYFASNVDDRTVVSLIAAAITVFLTLSVIFKQHLIALSRPAQSMYPDVIVRPALIVFIIASLMMLGRSEMTLRVGLALLAFAAFGAALVGGLLSRRATPDPVLEAEPRYAIGEWLVTGRYFLLLVFLNLTINQSDRILLSWLIGNEHVGTYNAAARLATLTGLGLIVANTISAPLFARYSSSGDSASMKDAIRTATRYSWTVGGSIALILVFFGEHLLGLFGPDFVSARNVLLVLLVGQTVSVAFSPVSHLLTMTGHHRVATSIIAAAAVVNIALNIMLIPGFGDMGAAIASAISIVMWNVAMFIAVRILVGVWSVRL